MANKKNLIEVVLFDVDGVLTDGAVYVNQLGEETKKIIFDDIDAIFKLKKAGIKIGFITAENNTFTNYIKQRFSPDYFLDGCKDKLLSFKRLVKGKNLKKETICYVGDSEKDAELLTYLDYSFTPANSPEKIKAISKYVLSANRGAGVISEVASFIFSNNSQNINQDKFLGERVNEHMQILNALLHDDFMIDKIEQGAKMMVRSLKNGGKILICGNGGSAADSQHFAAELVSRFMRERQAIDAEALSTDTSIITAVGNDYGFTNIFARQIEAKGKKGDILVAITTSGNSQNILKAIGKANEIGVKTIVLTGIGKHNNIRTLVDCCISVPSISTPRIQEIHVLIYHLICEYIEVKLSL